MWNYNTSIHEPEVEKIKNTLVAEGIADASVFEVSKTYDTSSGATHYPIVFLVDVSGSLRAERENLNIAIQDFIKDILGSTTTLSTSIDFSIITFADKVVIKRPFGYISEIDLQDNAHNCTIGENDIGGLTKMASGMFVAWYTAEIRKQMYKDDKLDYKQPVFVLITDLMNNEKTMIDDVALINKIIAFYNDKYEHHKLGLFKALFGDIDTHYNGRLKGLIIDSTNGFATMLHDIFQLLAATISDQDDKDYLVPDEDDGVFIFPDMTIEKQNPSSSEAIKELQKLFEDDVD